MSGRRTLKRLIAYYIGALLALAGAIWFELPQVFAYLSFATVQLLALIAAVSAGRTVADEHAALPYLKRPEISGRGAGALTWTVLALLAVACAYFVYPRSWPTSVEEAVEILSARLDEERKEEIGYMGYDDLDELELEFGAAIRAEFGLDRRNFRLAYDCDREYMHPHTCATRILSQLWKTLRNELPLAEQAALEVLERNMELVRLESERFDDVPLHELVTFFNEAIRTQRPNGEPFTVKHDPADAAAPVSVSWHAMGTISLREALDVLEQQGEWQVRKVPPDLIIERADPRPAQAR